MSDEIFVKEEREYENKQDENSETCKSYNTKGYVQCWLRSCEEEIDKPIQGDIKEKIPTWLNGSLIRNGPGTMKAGNSEFQHLFDSSALLHRFQFKNGNVTYKCRFVNSEAYKKILTANRLVHSGFGTKAVPDPCQTIFQRVSTLFNKSDHEDNSSVSVYPLGDEVYAFGEAPFIHKININNLETLDRIDVSKYISIVHHTAHPHIINDGSVYNVGISQSALGPRHCIINFPRKDESSKTTMFDNAKIVASIPARWPLHPSYMHTFGITENYFVIIEQPFCLSVAGMFSAKFRNDPIASVLKWFGEEYVQFNVISRETGLLVSKFQAKSFFNFHIINQYEDTNHLIIDICAYKDPSIMESMYYEAMKNMHKVDNIKMYQANPIRFVLPLKPKPSHSRDANLVTLEGSNASARYSLNGDIVVEPESLTNQACELPTINYKKHLGKKYRYFYAISADIHKENWRSIIKFDTETKTLKTWHEDNCFAGEPVFVPSPDSKFEDDGVVMSMLLWGNEDTNHVGLLILDATTFQEVGRAEFKTPCAIPGNFHGWYFPDKE